jgi:hypothetical protein
MTLWCASLLSWLVAVTAGLVAAPSYVGPVTVSLVAALAHCVCAAWLRRSTTRGGRLVLLMLTLPLVVLTADNVGRAVHLMDGSLFRLLP